MGQKVNPEILRVGITRGWESRWFAKKGFADLLYEDYRIRRKVKQDFYHAGISSIEIERKSEDEVKIIIHAARPGMVIGRKGAEVERLKKELSEMTRKNVLVDVKEVERPELDAQIVAENIATQIERRVAHRRAMKRAVSAAMQAGAQGIKITCSGRLGGSEQAKRQKYVVGKVPLHTLRADIDYGFAEARTVYGQIGVKVWIYKGDVLSPRMALEGGS
jgi:small subunit ribosomal protein S3